MTKKRKTQWHPAFCSAVRLEFREYDEWLDYTNEYNLTNKPMQIDMLIIKKRKDIQLQNDMGKIFKGHNIIEYKSPKDSLNEHAFFKVLGYACFYKSNEKHVGDILETDITITLVRQGFPKKFFGWLKHNNYTVRQVFPGVYYMDCVLGFAIQIIVTSYLSKESLKWITLLNEKLSKEDVRRAIFQSNSLYEKGEKEYADSVLQVVVAENLKMFDMVKKEGDVHMCEALLELMEPEISAAKLAAEQEGRMDILEKITTDRELREEYFTKYKIK